MTDVPPGAAAPPDPFLAMPGTVRMQLTVTWSGAVTPNMQRLVLTAPELAGFGYRPGQDVMLLVDRDGGRPVRRRYTIRELDHDRRLLTLDIVRHGEGPGEAWVRAAAPGSTVECIGPRGKISPVPDADWHLFVGDESSLAAIFAMARALPAGSSATVILEVPEAADEQPLDAAASVDATWLHRDGRPGGEPGALVEAVSEVPLLAERPHAYLMGEARVVSALREALGTRGLEPGQMSPKAYWGRGKANASHGEPARDG